MIAMLTLLMACGPKHASVDSAVNRTTGTPTAVSLDLPAPLPDHSVTFAPPEPTVLTLAHGGSLWFVPRPGLPLVSVRLLVPGGKAADPEDQPGLVSFADDMLTHGAGDMDTQAFAQATDQLAIDLGARTTGTYTIVSLETQTDRLEPALDLLFQAVLSPRFDPAEVDRMRDVRLGDLAVATDSPQSVAGWVADRVYYGAGHPLAHPAVGTVASTKAATADALKRSWRSRRDATPPTLVVVGDIDADSIVSMLDQRLSGWTQTGTSPQPPPPPAGVAEGPALYLVDNPGASQTTLEVVMPGPAMSDPTVDAARLGSIVLGGTFTSRLNRLLREEKGYTYGAFARLYPATTHGTIVASTAVQRDVTAPALKDLLSEIDRLGQGLSEDELVKARGSLQNDLIDSATRRSSLANAYAALIRSGRQPDAFTKQVAAAAAVTPQTAVSALADMTTQHAAVVVVGDLAKIQGAVQEAVPGNWIVVDKDGVVVSAAAPEGN